MDQEVLHLSLKEIQEGSKGAHQHLVYMHLWIVICAFRDSNSLWVQSVRI